MGEGVGLVALHLGWVSHLAAVSGKLDGWLSVWRVDSGWRRGAASGLFGEKALATKSEDKKLSFLLLHPHVTSFPPFCPSAGKPRPRGTCLRLPPSPPFFPPLLLRLSCASGGEMEWISRPTSFGKTIADKNAEQRRSRWRRSFLSSRSFFARLSRLGWSVMSH